MAFKDDAIPETYPQYGKYNWTKDKCTNLKRKKRKKIDESSSKSILRSSIFVVAAVLLGIILFIFFIKFVIKNLRIYKSVHSSSIPKQLVSGKFII